LQRPRFNPREAHGGYAVDEVAMGQILPLPIAILQMLCTMADMIGSFAVAVTSDATLPHY
jgi:hypothetical protein